VIKTTGSELALDFTNMPVSDRPGRDLLSNEEQLGDWIDVRSAWFGGAPAGQPAGTSCALTDDGRGSGRIAGRLAERLHHEGDCFVE
jgi:hypothetical protein